MAKHNAANERIKREYFHYLKQARRNAICVQPRNVLSRK